uniref:Uncharacterized protein n=1 Tax=Panagrolaimus superbus TaxID=310955 RepID=A0A914XSM7_9BILA
MSFNGGSSRMPMVNELLNELFPLSLEQQFYQSRRLNPDEAVAYGAAIRAAQLSDPSHRDYAGPITNALPIGIGIGLIEDKYSLMIKGQTKFPTKVKKRYFTTENNQKTASIVVSFFHQFINFLCSAKHALSDCPVVTSRILSFQSNVNKM